MDYELEEYQEKLEEIHSRYACDCKEKYNCNAHIQLMLKFTDSCSILPGEKNWLLVSLQDTHFLEEMLPWEADLAPFVSYMQSLFSVDYWEMQFDNLIIFQVKNQRISERKIETACLFARLMFGLEIYLAPNGIHTWGDEEMKGITSLRFHVSYIENTKDLSFEIKSAEKRQKEHLHIDHIVWLHKYKKAKGE